MQGVQPRPKRKPSSGAAASPTAGTECTRTSRCSHGTSPTNAMPSRITRLPMTTVISRRWLISADPKAPGQRAERDEDGR